MIPGIPDEAAEWHRVAEERRRQLERLQDQALYRIAAAAVGRVRSAGRRVLVTTDAVRDTTVRLGRSVLAVPRRVRAAERERALRESVAALPPPVEGRGARRADVTAVIVTATQPQRLDDLLVALGRLDVRALVVDNAGVAENAGVVARHPHAQHLRLEAPASFAVANEHAIAEVTTAWTLLLNDDVAPLDDRWLDRMLGAADDATVAVGAQLVHGPRGMLGGAPVDLTVQHAGIGLMLDGPLARPVHLGRGEEPSVTDAVRTVDAATAACLLVRTATHREVGGFHPGFDYGSEDVDLCLRLAEHGTLRVAMGAVLLHEEGATRLARRRGADRRTRAARQDANRSLLDARHAPALRRRVVRSTLEASEEAATGARLVLGAVGGAPERLVRALAQRPGVAPVTARGGALLIVTDPRRLPERGGAATGVPVVGWVTAGGVGRDPARWSVDALARVDALVVEDDLPHDVTDPTLPVHHVADEAETLAVLATLLLAPRWSLRTGAPGGRAADRWGDTPVADALARELRAHGLVVRTADRSAWGGPVDRSADVTLQLKGRGVAPVADAQTNIVWVMSHPSEVAPGELDAVDLVVAGSPLLAERYRTVTDTPVAMLPQAADARRFQPGPADPDVVHRVLFVGNTRSVPRPVVLGAVDAGLPLTLVGAGWTRYLEPSHVAREHVPYDELPHWYRSADVVLNDHWEDMARWGLVSNRVFDVLACGGCVVSDEVPGMDELLDGAVLTFADRADVGTVVRAALADPAGRTERAERGRRVVLASHTWEHRAAKLVQLATEHTSEHP